MTPRFVLRALPRVLGGLGISLAAVAGGASPVAAQDAAAHEPRTKAQRIVTLGGSVTEIVFALGAGEQVVGVDQSSHLPAEVAKLPKVGNFRSISAEGLLSLAPTLVIATDDAGPPAVLAQLRAAGVELHLVPTAQDLSQTVAKILGVGAALGLEEEARSLAAKVAGEVRAASEWAAGASSRPRALFIYARGAGHLFVSGRGTAAAEILRLAGADNAISAFEGYRSLTAEAVVAAAPDLIVIPTLGLESIGGIKGLLALPGIGATPAARARRIVTMDDGLLLGFGPRLGAAVRDLARQLHPEQGRAGGNE